ncbi:hypothetical protein LCGC14_1535770 [marine sediment metagenome]|uniref:Uncharacterized protein n=1 Tax=marine sediment metagenome TaxID=412755 RepID=A0A0F9JFG3_9ZZZZ
MMIFLLKRWVKIAVITVIMIIGIILIIWSIIQQIAYPKIPIYSTFTTVLCSSFFFSLPYIIKYFFNQPNLFLELEKYRDELIQIYQTHTFSQSRQDNKPKRFNVITSLERKQEGEKSKYIRIKLVNNGRKTAKNCRIKIHIFKPWYEKVHEESYIYPSGYHQSKKSREIPPPINIAPKDSQIFDICSSNNLWENDKLIRFEDYFTYSTIQGQEDLNLLKNYHIKLFVYSDNNPAFEKQYNIFKNEEIKGLDWEILDIKENEWEKKDRLKGVKIKEIFKKFLLKLKRKIDIKKNMKNKVVNKVENINNRPKISYSSVKAYQKPTISERKKIPDYTTGYFTED